MPRRRRIWKRRRTVDPHPGLSGLERTYAVQLSRHRGDTERARDVVLNQLWWDAVEAFDCERGISHDAPTEIESEEEADAYEAAFDEHWATVIDGSPLLSEWKKEGHPCRPAWVVAQEEFEADFARTHP